MTPFPEAEAARERESGAVEDVFWSKSRQLLLLAAGVVGRLATGRRLAACNTGTQRWGDQDKEFTHTTPLYRSSQ